MPEVRVYAQGWWLVAWCMQVCERSGVRPRQVKWWREECVGRRGEVRECESDDGSGGKREAVGGRAAQSVRGRRSKKRAHGGGRMCET